MLGVKITIVFLRFFNYRWGNEDNL